jgi:hypothetical protein
MPGKTNKMPQSKRFEYPALFVAESNATSTQLPSALKTAEASRGVAGISSKLRTFKWATDEEAPACEKITSYADADGPLRSTSTAYSPALVPATTVTTAELAEDAFLNSSTFG